MISSFAGRFSANSVSMFKPLAALVLLGFMGLIAGCGGGDSAAAVVPPPTVTLASISIAPPDSSLAMGLTSQFAATGVYSDGSKKDISASVTWTSGTPATASISPAGLAKALTAGSTMITATSGGVSGSTTLTVTAATLVSIGVTPAIPSIALGTTKQFVATGTYSDNSTQVLTTVVTWTSATVGVATINSAGLATSVAAGSSVITATSGSISGTTTLTVTAATLVSIAVTPATANLTLGAKQQFVATGTYSNNSTQVLTASVTWTSSVPATATISNVIGLQGQATAVAVGTTSITAALGGVTSPGVTVTVTAATLVSIAVTPAIPNLPKGNKLQFVATGTYSNNTTQVITTSVVWSSSVPAIATISNAATFDGQATGVAVGTTVITAALSGITSPADTLTVTAATLVSIAVTPAAPSILNGTTQQFVATGTYTDGTTQVLTTTATWASGTPATATISNAAGSQGLATASAVGTTSITAMSGTITSPAVTLTVTAAEYLYATDLALGHVLQYTIGNNGTLTPMATPFVSADVNPTGLAIDPTHHFLYVANSFSGDVSQYTIGTTGALTPMATATVVAGAGANAVTIDASGTHAYVPNATAGTVSQFAIAANGALTALTPASVAGAAGAAVMVINSTGTFAYVVNYSGNSISLFSIAAGLLTHVSDTTVTGPPGNMTAPLPNSLVIDPTGKYLYTADSANGSIGQFSIDAVTGALTPLAPNAYISQGAHSLAILQQGAAAYVYASNAATGTVVQFAVNEATGDLGANIGIFNAAPTGTTSPISVAFDPTKNFAYAADEGNQTISQFIVGAGGAFTAQTPATVATGSGSGPVYMLATTAY